MSVMPDVNLKQTLRRIDFPQCAIEALIKIGELLSSRATNIKNMDLALDLMSEFIFCEVDRRGNKRQIALTPLLELQLLEILYEHFNNLTIDYMRNTVFLSLFSGAALAQRMGILSKLVSLAIGIPSACVLMCASTWMQQLGNTSVNSCKLAESIVFDYFHLVPHSVEKLNTLPALCPQFTANFLTALADNYFNTTKREQNYPPNKLLETITLWISENNSLCTSAQQKPPALPPGAIAMEATTPIAGLIKWCTLAPIYNQHDDVYCRLHLAILNSILEIPPTNNPPKAIAAHQLAQPMRHLLLLNNKNGKHNISCNNLQAALDRYAQSIQVALSKKVVYGKLDELIVQLKQLPFNKLMHIVINAHRNNI